MRLTVLGGSGAWPTADQGCGGFLVEHDGFRLLIDPGYATFSRLLASGHSAHAVDAVLVSHGHPDHCADLNPLLRARQLADAPAPPLPLHAPRGALDAVLALDKRSMLAGSYRLHEFWPEQGGTCFEIGPFRVEASLLPHFVPNAGLRLTAPDGTVLAYTGDTGPSPDVARLARDADLFLCEATYVHEVPDPGDAPYLLTAALAGTYAERAGARELLLTHLWPGTAPAAALASAAVRFGGPTRVTAPGLTVEAGGGK
ncbi:MBL fold metallo-hydrolase [Streptomyces sp. NPDC048172]|uniref:MBL fold metallo-hydrolase n=1 Tax=Streptomyces sp. NPDC048172 TaxID=3365505 RepID=UPI00371871AE